MARSRSARRGTSRWPLAHGRALPRQLLRRRQPRALRDEPLQRSAAALVLPADRARAACCRGRRWRSPCSRRSLRARARPAPRLSSRTWRLLVWACAAAAVLHRLDRQAAALHPAHPAAARAAARRAIVSDRPCATASGRDPLLQVPAAVVALLLARMAVLLYRARPLIVMVPTVFIIAAVIAIAVARGSRARPRRSRRARARCPARIAVAGALTLAGLQYGAVAGRPRSGAGHGRAGAGSTERGTEPVGTYRVFVRNLVFYTGVQADRSARANQQVVDFLHRPSACCA